MGRFPFLFLSFTLGVQLWFWPHLCGTTTQTPFPCPGEQEWKQLGLLKLEKGMVATSEVCVKCSGGTLWQQLQQTGSCLLWWEILQPHGGRGCCVGAVAALPPVCLTMASYFPGLTMLLLWAFLAAQPLTPVLWCIVFFFYYEPISEVNKLTLNWEYPWAP